MGLTSKKLEEFTLIPLFVGGFIFIISIISIIYLIDQYDMSKVGQIGDFIGGVVGVVWSLVGVLLLWSTLKSQNTQFDLQATEREKQNIQFEINRISNILYQQLDRVNRVIDDCVFKLPHEKNGFRGIIGIAKLHTSLNALAANINTNTYMKQIENNELPIFSLTNSIHNSISILELILSKSSIPTDIKDEMKEIFFKNLSYETKELLAKILKIHNQYINTVKPKELNLTNDSLIHSVGPYIRRINDIKDKTYTANTTSSPSA